MWSLLLSATVSDHRLRARRVFGAAAWRVMVRPLADCSICIAIECFGMRVALLTHDRTLRISLLLRSWSFGDVGIASAL
jgi:hypothetical protein